jgi:hypothetical protein
MRAADADYNGILEDAKMSLTLARGDEQVDCVAEATANAPITPSPNLKGHDGKSIKMVETKSLLTSNSELHENGSNQKEDGDLPQASCAYIISRLSCIYFSSNNQWII